MSDKNMLDKHGSENEFSIITWDPNKTPMLSFNNNNGKRVGELWYRNGRLEFEGDVDESAERLFEIIQNLWENYLREQR